MNLIKDAWLPAVHADGRQERIAPWQIAEKENPVMELNAPRPDFQGALYQFLIGLLQTGFVPDDHDEWLAYWEEAPETDALRERLGALATAFALDEPEGPAFLQDLNLDKREKKSIGTLLIDAPGSKTRKDNLDFFVKRGSVECLCPSCAATALFTLQTNAPAGGVGNRVGIRGGGPLTTLVRPVEETNLWQKIWLNVLDAETLIDGITTPDVRVFPWLAETRVSNKGGKDTRPEDGHLLQVYWGMPRRIHICFEAKSRKCDLCAEDHALSAKAYVTQNYGINYVGEWIHPLTPYRFDSKNKNPPLSLKGQQGGLGYRHWLGLFWSDPYNGDGAAKVTRVFLEKRAHDIGSHRFARLWCFGYDMDNMKARCWYDGTFPLFELAPAQRENVVVWAGELINAARETADCLRQQVKAAWFRRPEDVKGDMSAVVIDFWRTSETEFYQLLELITTLPGEQRQAPPETYMDWANKLWSLALQLFDAWSMETITEDLDMKRIIAAREGLKKKLNTSKSMKNLRAKGRSEKEVA